MNTLLLIIATYLITGAALTSYDFSAPPLHAKLYVVRHDHAAAFRNLFIWPLTTAFDVYQEAALQRNPGRLAIGILMLAAGVLVVVRFVFLMVMLFRPWSLLAYGLAFGSGLLASPIVTALVMPKHGQTRRG